MEISRRSFAESLVVLPVGVFLLRCSSSSDGSGANEPAAPPTISGTSAVYSSSEVESHHHTFTIPLADFSNPPAGGDSGETGSTEAHTHTVSVSASALQSVEAGGSVMIASSTTSGHRHVFTFVKVSGATGTGGASGTGGTTATTPPRY